MEFAPLLTTIAAGFVLLMALLKGEWWKCVGGARGLRPSSAAPFAPRAVG